MKILESVFGVSKKNNQPEAQIPLTTLKSHIEQQETAWVSQEHPLSNLAKIMRTRNHLRRRKSEVITFSKPIISHGDIPIIFPNTINLIQGQAGVHKSRFSELFISVLLRLVHCMNTHLGFQANSSIQYTAVYVDTERNLNEQFPYALQQIQLQAGYELTDNPENFDFISLLEIPRKERFETLSSFLQQIRQEHDNHIFIVLDVVTDCIEDFNRTDDSMQLADMLNLMINRFNVTFLCVIHENPSSNNKARGHLGTELMNKASTVMQVGFEQNGDNSPSNIIRLKYLKCRSTERPNPLHVIFDKETRQLVLADAQEVSDVFDGRKSKATENDVLDFLSDSVEAYPIVKMVLVKDLASWLSTSTKTIEERLNTIIENEKLIYREAQPFTLVKADKQGRNVMFNLKPFENHDK